MFLVALGPCLLEPDDKAARLVRTLFVTPSEARQHSLVPAPRAVAARASLAEARALADRLVGDGLPALVLGPDDVITDAKRFLARTFVVTDEGVGAVRKDGGQARLPWGDVAFAIVGVRKTGAPFVDLVDGNGGALSVRERDTLFDASTGLGVTGARAGVVALGQLARQKSNARVDDALIKPGALQKVLGAFASTPTADDWAVSLVVKSLS